MFYLARLVQWINKKLHKPQTKQFALDKTRRSIYIGDEVVYLTGGFRSEVKLVLGKVVAINNSKLVIRCNNTNLYVNSNRCIVTIKRPIMS